MKAVPLPYQSKSIEAIDGFKGRALLAHEMGLGKTLISLWWWEKTPTAHPGLVVCPASMKYVWEHEALQHIGVRPLVLEGRMKDLKHVEETKPKLVVVNYDVLHSWLPWLERFGFKSLFVDEIHYCKNPGSQRSKAVGKMAKGVRKIIGISGTPLMNRPIELYPILKMIKPSAVPTKYHFQHEFCKPTWTPWGWKYDGATKTDELHALLKKTCMIRYLKSEVLPELPEKVRRVLPVSMAEGNEYDQAKENFLGWLGSKNPAKLLAAEKAETLVKLGYLKRLAARSKLRSVVEWVNQWLENYPKEKLVVFAVHKKMIQALKRRVEAKSIVVDGSVTGRKRKIAVNQFQDNKKVRVLLGNIKAAGVGITLTAASTLVFVELDWVPTVHTQAEDRIHRIGQTKTSWIWYLVAAGTIEEDLCEILERKQKVVSAVLDGGSPADDLNVYQQLLLKMKGKK